MQLVPYIIAIIGFFLQSYPRFFNKFFGVDVWTRLLETDHVRKNNHNIPQRKIEGQFIIDGYFDYPPIFPYLMSYIPRDTLLSIQGFVAPFFDALQSLLVFWLASYLTQNIHLAYVAQMIYILTPVIAVENSYLTPRSLGYLNFSLAAISLLLYHYQMGVGFLVAGIIFTTMLFLTHRFAVQAFLFLTLFFTFYLNTPLFIQTYIVGFALAVLLTQGYYLRVLKGHLYNIYFWVMNLDYRYAHQVRGVIRKDTETDTVNKLYKLIEVFSPIAIFGMNPWAISGFAIIALSWLHLVVIPPLYYTMAMWIVFFYFFGVVVLKVRRLMPIGEGYRYMEMATVPASILSSMILFTFINRPYGRYVIAGYVVLGVINLGVILFFQIKSVIGDRNRSVTVEMHQVFAYINRHSKVKSPMRIICVPHQNTTMTVYHTRAQVLVNADNPGLMRVTDVYPILRKSLKELARKYNLSHVLIKTGFVSLKELKLSERDVVFKSGDVMLVKL